MPPSQPLVSTLDGQRQFPCYPAAVLVFIVNAEEKILLLAHPKRHGGWEVVNGGLEANETVIEAARREVREEAGPEIRARPLGVFHTTMFRYDEAVPYMFSVSYLMAYESGAVVPGDDMRGSRSGWWAMDEIRAEDFKLLVPPDMKWQMQRALECYRLWKEQTPELQADISVTKSKYAIEEA